jgi:putative ABC transport system permease protein
MTSDIGNWGVVLAALLIGMTIVISAWRGLGLERSLAWAAIRCAAQLIAVGLILEVLIDPGQPLALSWIWVMVMISAAAITTQLRAPEVPGAGWLAAVAFTLATAVCLAVLLGAGVFPTEGRTIVPLAGLVIGNSLSATVIASRRIVGELRDHSLEVEARLALGQPSQVAAYPYMKLALRTSLIPRIETTKAVGLIALPGAMVGLLLAGVEPMDAIRVQIAVMYVVLASVTITAATISIGLMKRLFTSDHRLVRLERTAD